MVKKKILIYEQEAIVALDIKTILARSGEFQPKILKKEEDFSRIINAEKPELIITSVNSPLLLPESILSSIKMRHIPIVVLTDNIQENLIEQVKTSFGGDILLKPFNKDELISCIKHLTELSI